MVLKVFLKKTIFHKMVNTMTHCTAIVTSVGINTIIEPRKVFMTQNIILKRLLLSFVEKCL